MRRIFEYFGFSLLISDNEKQQVIFFKVCSAVAKKVNFVNRVFIKKNKWSEFTIFLVKHFIYAFVVTGLFWDTLLLALHNRSYVIFDNSITTSAFRLAPIQKNSGLGNILSIYWYGRAIAYWQGMNFELKHAQWLAWSPKVSNTFLQYLPSYASFEEMQLDEMIGTDEYNQLKKKLENLEIDLNAGIETRYSHVTSQLMTYYNNHFMQFIIADTHAALQRHFKVKPNNGVIYREKLVNKHDVVIHFRCGDILHRGHELYHFLTLQYYTYILDYIIKEYNISDEIRLAKMKVFMLSQITQEGVHLPSDVKSIEKCQHLIWIFRDVLSERYPNVFFEVMNNDIVNDFAMMVYAPHLICSTSSFCLHAALANKAKHVFLPDIGPWTFFTLHKSLFLNTSFLPSTHFVVDVQQNAWSIKSTDVVHTYFLDIKVKFVFNFFRLKIQIKTYNLRATRFWSHETKFLFFKQIWEILLKIFTEVVHFRKLCYYDIENTS
ncbi:hypothetical protein RFI_11458 [Reticulomyxa filosa]|uniref:Uncharacterized protein n=1 Tax=Reticulomyxa filosa TaxID=46433 RepID=X6NJZ1_RETFI|nr:hypothetical protein RFI_11458 [Reticulomyxa filosa]|eukprot:ETO25677.1 hypothetical protein RFI_11458 [Reticulomyxa filosa]